MANILRYNILTLVISDLNCLVATRINQSEPTLIIFVLTVILVILVVQHHPQQEGPNCKRCDGVKCDNNSGLLQYLAGLSTQSNVIE